jgi:hypothetical protein
VRSAVIPSEETDLSGILQSVEAQAAEELRQSSFLVVLPDGERGKSVVQSLLQVKDLADLHRLREELLLEKVDQNLRDRLHVVKRDLGAQGPRVVFVLSEEGIEAYVNQAEGMKDALGLDVSGGELAQRDWAFLISCILLIAMLAMLCVLILASGANPDLTMDECLEIFWVDWLLVACELNLSL